MKKHVFVFLVLYLIIGAGAIFSCYGFLFFWWLSATPLSDTATSRVQYNAKFYFVMLLGFLGMAGVLILLKVRRTAKERGSR